MEIIVEAKTTAESYDKERAVGVAACDDVKCKLCEY